jgi:hypothetical protein
MNRIPVRDLLSHDMGRSSGFEWPSCPVVTLSGLIANGFLSAVEAERLEFASERKNLIRLAGVVLTGLIISRFKSDLRKKISTEPSVIDLAERRRGTARQHGKVEAKPEHGARLDRIRASIESRCSGAAASLCLDDEGGDLGERCSALVRAIGEEILRLVDLADPRVAEAIAVTVLTYAGRLGVAESLSLMLVEFIQLAEKSYFYNLAERDRYVRNHPEELRRLLATWSFRERLMEIAASRGESMLLKIDFVALPSEQGGRERIDISTRTRGLIGYNSRNDVVNSKSKTVRTMDLASLLALAAGNDDTANLGIAYHANLVEACANEGMLFSSSVVLDEYRDETVATMSLTL